LEGFASPVNNEDVTDEDKPDRPERAVLNGVVALAAVALAVGLVLAGVALVGTRMLGLSGGDSAADDGQSERESLYLPPVQKTSDDGPAITLGTDEPEETGETETATETTTEPTDKKSPKHGEISLQAVQSEVAAGENIDFTGVYPGGEGAVLQVQRFEGGSWADFEATIPVSDEQFSTYVFTGVTGLNRFRVIDNATGTFSNEVRVRVG
jgi:hypothetical protein